MVTPHLSVRSSKARDLAQKLARRENRTIADIVERALETYEAREAGREPAAKFYSRLHRSRVRISMSTASSMKTDALTKASSFDFSRHECDVGDFEESSSFLPSRFRSSLCSFPLSVRRGHRLCGADGAGRVRARRYQAFSPRPQHSRRRSESPSEDRPAINRC